MSSITISALQYGMALPPLVGLGRASDMADWDGCPTPRQEPIPFVARKSYQAVSQQS